MSRLSWWVVLLIGIDIGMVAAMGISIFAQWHRRPLPLSNWRLAALRATSVLIGGFNLWTCGIFTLAATDGDALARKLAIEAGVAGVIGIVLPRAAEAAGRWVKR